MRDTAWRTPVGALAVLVIAAQAVWRGIVLARGYYSQQDFLVLSRTRDFGWGAVFGSDHAGGFAPGRDALAWLETQVDPMGWPVAVAGTLVLEGVAAVLTWLVLHRVLGRHWARLPLLVVACFTPLTLWTTQWWSMALVLWAATSLLLLAVWATLKAVQDHDARYRVVVVATLAGALCFSERAALYVVPIAMVGCLAHLRTAGARRGLGHAVHAEWRVWLGLLSVIVVYVTLRALVAPVPLGGGGLSSDVVTTYLRHAGSGLAGGPWLADLPGHAFLLPRSWTVAANVALFLAFMAFTLQRGGLSARVAWLGFVVYVGCSVALLSFVGRGDLVASLGLVPAFAAELVPVLVVAAAGALSNLSLPAVHVRGTRLGERQLGGLVAVGAVGLFTVSAALSTAMLAPNLYHRDDRSFVDRVRAELRRSPQVVLLDRGAPPGVLSPWYGDRATISTVLSAAPEQPVFDVASHALRYVTDSGRLAPVALQGGVRMVPSENTTCGYPVRATGRHVDFQQTVPPGRWVLRLGYYTNVDSFGTVAAGGVAVRFPVRRGLNAVDVPLTATFDRMEVSIEAPDATLCLAAAEAGTAVPRRPAEELVDR